MKRARFGMTPFKDVQCQPASGGLSEGCVCIHGRASSLAGQKIKHCDRSVAVIGREQWVCKLVPGGGDSDPESCHCTPKQAY